MARYLQRPRDRAVDEDFTSAVVESAFEEGLRPVGAFLLDQEWDPGEARTPGSITVFAEQGILKCCLHDKDADCVCFVSGPSWQALWACVAHGLAHGALDWRPSRGKGQRKS